MSARGNLTVRVQIAPDVDPDSDPTDWVWLDVTSYRRTKVDVEINQGRDDESSEVEAGDASCTFNLRDGLLSPRNPYSDLYGRIGVNTPIRFGVEVLGDTFGRTEAAGSWGTSTSGAAWSPGGSGWSVSGGAGRISLAAANTITHAYAVDVGAGDLDVTYSVSAQAVTTGAPWISVLQFRRVDADNVYFLQTELKPAGVVTVKLQRFTGGVGTSIVEDLTTSATYSADTKVWTRMQAEGADFRAKVWSGVAADEPDDWNITATLAFLTGTLIGISGWRFVGNTNVGAFAVAVDDLAAVAWVFQGNVPEWPPRWDKSGNDSIMTVAAAGPMRQLGQGDSVVESPLTRQLGAYSPAGWWPGEDGEEAIVLGSGIVGGTPAETHLVSLGQTDAPGGAAGAFKIDETGSTVNGTITGDSTANWAAMFFVKFASLPGSDTVVMTWRCKTGTARQYTIRANATGWQMKIYDADNALILDGGTVAYGSEPTEWSAVQLEVQQNGGNVDWALNWNRLDTEIFWTTSSSFAGTTARLSTFYIPGSTGLVDALYSHVWTGPNTLPFVDWTFLAVANGYAGELASDRIQRLCDQRNVLVEIHDGDSEPLGVQPPGKFLDLLRNSSAADLGVLYEGRSGSLAFLPRSARYNEPVTLALDWAGGDLAEAPAPTDDDQRLRNRWKVSRRGGSSATYENAESIARHGLVPDGAEINIAEDERLSLFASWYTALTTVDELRWPVIELDLVAHPELRAAFMACRIGSRVTVANPKSQIAGVTIDLIIEGIKQTIGRNAWKVALACSPASSWKVGVWDDETRGRWGAATTTVQADAAAGAGSITITTVDPLERWSTTASGYQWDLAGEIVTVDAMGAATGSGPYEQVATVTRGVNGVDKLIPAGTKVKMANPTRWGL